MADPVRMACPLCRRPTILLEHRSRPVLLDDIRLSPAGEAQALMARLRTFRLDETGRLTRRLPCEIAMLPRPVLWDVHREHRCDSAAVTGVAPARIRPNYETDDPGF